MGEKISVAVVGAGGRMGQEVLRALTWAEDFDIAVAVDHSAAGKNIREFAGPKARDLEIQGKLGAALDATPCQVLIDFTNHSAAAQHALSALKRGIRPVLGTTGMSSNDLREIEADCKEKKLGAIYAPNFAIGAVLMMRFAEMAAQWLPDVEIIEMHHEQKLDAPSGTALLTAEMISEGRTRAPGFIPDATMKIEGARGGKYRDVPIHSVRLPGLVAHQMVMFGSAGETLTIRHDSLDRKSFMEGVKLCLREVLTVDGLVIGMDKVLFKN